ncbi:MAG: T9SS type A sorting domain-containing protein, partial [Rhodothermales bacterium]|nr:T9SS type A sorting domain-containing protein [Rhodothermales bacterium]
MYPTPADGLGRDKVGDHTFGVTYVAENGDRVDNTAACVNCHGVFDSFAEFMSRSDDDGDGVVEPIQDEIHGLLEHVAMLLPPEGTTDILPGNDPFWAAPENLLYRKAFWNYLMMEEEGSFGVHNYQFSVAVLKLTAQALEFGVLDAGMIMGIEDVPNDQGRQVGVAWSRFGGDGPSDTPIDDYYVWRAVESVNGAKAAYQSFSEVPVVTEDGGVDLSSMSVMLDGHLWTAVGHQPAAAFPMYSAVVPTLGDATATDTLWSTFVVSGHVAGAPDMTIITEPMMGYSVDNLVPTAPMMSAAGSKRKVELVFELDREEYRNADFDYFAIYRSTESGFDPVGMEPFATTAEDVYDDTEVTYNNTYYYRAAAFDFSGNQGEFSDEVMGAVGVGVDGTGEIPIAFELYQNYPNPFNPSTTIAFDVPQTSDVSVAVFDLLGRQVRTLVNGSLPAGKHTVTLNAQSMSSGLYVVRFDTPDGAFERTILLIK